jgi:hypothetical protein
MPRKGKRRVGRPCKSQSGKGIGADIIRGLKKANDWARKTKVISKVANTLADVGVPYARQVSNVSGQLGYGMGSYGAQNMRPRVIPAMMKR